MNLKTKLLIYLLSIAFIAAITCMVYDYVENPPFAIDHEFFNKRGNEKGSLFLYIPLATFEFICGILILWKTNTISYLVRGILSITFLTGTFYAYIITIGKGGVEAAHAIWMTVCMGIVLFVFVLIRINRKKKFTINNQNNH